MRVRILALSVAIVLMPGFTLAQDTKPAAKEPAARHATVLAGSFLVAHGDEGPFVVNFVNPQDAPK